MRPVRRRPDAAGRSALDLYRRLPLAARLHTTIRWWTAPFRAVEAAVPRRGRVLEIGCGHGLFAAYAACAAGGREVLGTDIDVDKIALAQQAARPLAPRLHFAPATSGEVPAGPWDAVVVLDVLYLLPAEAQRDLLTACAAQLAPGGVLLVKEMAQSPAWKARWNRIQETLAVKVLRITEGHDFDFVPTEQVCRWLTDAGLAVQVQPLDRARLHPHQLVVARRLTP